MFHAKYQSYCLIGSGGEVVCMVFTIYGHDGHHEIRIMAFLTRSCITII